MGSAGERQKREVATFSDRYIFLSPLIYAHRVHTVVRGVAPSVVKLRASFVLSLFLDNPNPCTYILTKDRLSEAE